MKRFHASSKGLFWKGIGKQMLPGFLGASVKSLFLLPCPYLLKRIIDVYIPHKNSSAILLSIAVCGGLVVMYVGMALWANRWIVRTACANSCQLRNQLVARMGGCEYVNLDESFSSDIENFFFSDIQKIETATIILANNFLPIVLYSASMMSLLLFIDWRIGALVVFLVAMLIAMRWTCLGPLKRVQAAEDATQILLGRSFRELTHGHRFLRAIGHYVEFSGETYLRTAQHGETRQRLAFTLQELLSFLVAGQQFINILVITGGAFAVMYWDVKIGTVIVAILVLPSILAPLQMLPDALEKYLMACRAKIRITDFLALENEPSSGRSVASEAPFKVELKQVSFRYKSRKELILADISHTIHAGEMIAIVGESGGGKTTLANLIVRLYRPESGQIMINDIDLADYDLRSLRRRIGLVPQDSIIFNSSITQNIRVGCDQATMDDIRWAANLANADEFIDRLPGQYNYIVGEKGARLSGGQKQRIALARALVRRPGLLILDEATSALDEESEMAIQSTLSRIRGEHTTLIIAHRLATIRRAHRVLVISGGRIRYVLSPEQWIGRSAERHNS